MKIAIITGGSRAWAAAWPCTWPKRARRHPDLQQKAGDADAVVSEIEKLGRKAVALQLDIGDHQSFAAFAEKVRGALTQHWQRTDFDFLINNAGVGVQGRSWKRRKRSLTSF